MVPLPVPGRGLAAVLVLLSASCTQPAAPNRAVHPTIVSLNPCSDAVLAEVADPGQLLAVSRFSHDREASSMGAAKARHYPAVSGSVEEILAFAPDIVVGDYFMGPAAADALRRLGVRLEQIPIDASVADSEAHVRRLAALAGHPERGEALVARMEAALARAAPPPGSPPVPAVVWQAGGMVPGDGTLIADLLQRTGFSQLSAVRGLRQGEILPLEAMLADPPRVIFAAANPLGNENRALAHPALRHLAGTRYERFPANLLWCGGPTVIKAAGRLAQARASMRPRAGGGLGAVYGYPAKARGPRLRGDAVWRVGAP
jgi:iron complex transport system substrate-binding protein